jgi:hypothetical protein
MVYKPRLFKLNPDGTRQYDLDGNFLYTYDSDDIMSYARAWTGLTKQKYRRGNLEDESGDSVDPVTIDREKRDVFPKTDLMEGYVGDGFPLCADRPPMMHLRKVSAEVVLYFELVTNSSFLHFFISICISPSHTSLLHSNNEPGGHVFSPRQQQQPGAAMGGSIMGRR